VLAAADPGQGDAGHATGGEAVTSHGGGQPQLLEGYVDLLYRRVTGLVVVDYKTGPSSPDDDLDALVERYRLQGASYALAVGEAVGDEPVVDVVFVFLTPQGAVERSLPDLAAAVAHACRQIEAGTFALTG
jgi:ATP-dependent exoDNAse (exonuclease V) beta subunit